jgi:hypothetical protein
MYQVGQPIRVRVVAVGRRDAAVKNAEAGLVAKIWYGQRAGTATPWGLVPDPNPQPTVSRTVTGSTSGLDLSGPWHAGVRAERELVLANWASAPSGGRAPGRRIEYRVRGVISFADGSMVCREAPVRLLSGRSLNQSVEGTARAYRTRNCDLSLELPVLHARPGETLRGVLRVRPRRPVRVRRVLVYLLRVEGGPRLAVRYAVYRRNIQSPIMDLLRARSVTLARRVELTAPREFPFTVRLPEEAVPTLLTPYLSVRWYVRARVWYGLRGGNDMYDLELNVYTGS